MAISEHFTPEPGDRTLVAPLWHTAILVAGILSVSLLQARQQVDLALAPAQIRSRLPLYAATIIFEVTLFLYVWLLGLRLTRTPLRALIGGRWTRAADVMRDIGAAAVFWVIVVGVLLLLGKILGVNTTELRAVKPLLPKGPLEVATWVALCVVAGFCEEVVFRGYLQTQFFAITGRTDFAIVFQAVVFGFAHMYQGMKGVITIAVYGSLFGILAVVKKSLRPGMIQHAAQDIFSGLLGAVLTRH